MANIKTVYKLVGYFLIGFGLTLTALTAHCATTSSKQSNGNTFGALVYQENPNQYLMGSISNADAGVTRAGKRVLVFEVRPTNTYSMFSQSVAFCSVSDEQIATLISGSVVVLTYSRVMHHMDCYDLYRVDRVGVQ